MEHCAICGSFRANARGHPSKLRWAGQVKGAYVADERVTEPSKSARDPVIALKLWEASSKMTGVTPSPNLD
jgi:hypothetical protein